MRHPRLSNLRRKPGKHPGPCPVEDLLTPLGHVAAMERVHWPGIDKQLAGRRIVSLWYGLEDGYLRLELDDGSTVLVAASWEGVHAVLERPGGPPLTCTKSA